MQQQDNVKPKFVLLKKLFNEIIRIAPLLAFITPFLFFDDSWHMVTFVTAMLGFILIAIHVVRKSMYPYIDIEVLVKKAEESPLASAIVVFALMLFFSTIVLSYVLLLR